MSTASTLPLRDVHLSGAPSLWPPPPGWWLCAAAVVLLLALIWWWRRRPRRTRTDWVGVFDREVDAGESSSARIARMSELLRRAARAHDAAAATLSGEAWLAWLDGDQPGRFSAGEGRRLLEDGYRPDSSSNIGALQSLARARFVELMAARR